MEYRIKLANKRTIIAKQDNQGIVKLNVLINKKFINWKMLIPD